MSEIKPCPFCGGKAVTSTFFDWDDFEYMPIEVNDSDVEVTCENERCINGWYLSPKAWNTRPIEDELRKRIAELEAENDELKERVAMLDVTAVYKSLGEMGYIEQVDRLNARIAELEGKFDQLTARWRQERQDDKSSNDTQTQTIHGEDVCPKCHGTRLIGYDDCSGADCQDCGYFISEDEMRRRNESKI